MRRSVARHVSVAAATLCVLSAFVGSAVTSRAAVIGNLVISPPTGDDSTAMTLMTPGPCLTGDNVEVFVTGPGFPAGGYPLTVSTPLVSLALDAQGRLALPPLETMEHAAAAQSPAATLDGGYVLSARCISFDGLTIYDSFNEAVVFTHQTAAASTYVASVEVPFGYFTSMALSAAPSGPIPSGSSVTLTAHLSSSPLGGAEGTVQFMDGASGVGSPTTVDGLGNATVIVGLTGAGDHTITAAFTGKYGYIVGSTSPPLVLSVLAGVADPAATSLAITPATATTASSVTLTASVMDVPHSGSTPVGTIQFSDRGIWVGTTQPVGADGTASYTHEFSAGSHSFTASFVPTDSSVFGPSSSTSQVYDVAAGPGAAQQVETTIDPGSLTISVADASTVVLHPPTLNAAATFLTTSGALHHVTVTDSRAGSPGWVVSGQVTDFYNTNGTIDSVIPGVDLGWTPVVVDEDPGQTVTPGSPVPAAAPPFSYDAAAAGGAGLHTSRQLASAAPGAGTGTAHLGATLTLNVPTTVTAGTYSAVLTLTAI